MRRAIAAAEVGDEHALPTRARTALQGASGELPPRARCSSPRTLSTAISFRLHPAGGYEVLLDAQSHPITRGGWAGGPISSAILHLLDGTAAASRGAVRRRPPADATCPRSLSSSIEQTTTSPAGASGARADSRRARGRGTNGMRAPGRPRLLIRWLPHRREAPPTTRALRHRLDRLTKGLGAPVGACLAPCRADLLGGR